MPDRSHASSNWVEGGLWLVRMALKPFAFNISILRSSALSILADPNSPRSWWIHPPFNKTFLPFIVNPPAASTWMLLIPNTVSKRSIVSFPFFISVTVLYNRGVSTYHKAGLSSVMVSSSVSDVFALTISAFFVWLTAFPSGERTVVIRMILPEVVPSFCTVDFIFIVALISDTSGVVINTPREAIWICSVVMSQTWRYIPEPLYQRVLFPSFRTLTARTFSWP